MRPTRATAGPSDFKAFVEAAHARGIAVLLDVVYNHFGPDGNYLPRYAPDFFTGRHKTPWGDAINYDGPNARPVRDFVIENAEYWLEEFHLDGLQARRGPRDQGRQPARHPRRARRARAAARFDRGRSISCSRTRTTSRGRLRRGAAAGRPATRRSGTTTSTTSCMSRPRARRSGYYGDYGETRRCWRGRSPRASPIRASRRRIASAPRGDPSADLPPDRLRRFPPEPRPDRQPRLRRTARARSRPPAVVRALASVYLLSAADPDAVHGRGMGRDAAVPVLLRFPRRSRRSRARRTARRNSRASRVRRSERATSDSRSAGRRDLPRLEARLGARIDAEPLAFYRDGARGRAGASSGRCCPRSTARAKRAIARRTGACAVAWQAARDPARPRRQPRRPARRRSRRRRASSPGDAARPRNGETRTVERALERRDAMIPPRATYRLQLRESFGFADAAAHRALSRAARHQPCLSVADLQGAARQRARLRHHRPQRAQSGARDGGRLRRDDRGVPPRGSRRRPRHRARTTWASAAPTIRCGSTCSNGAPASRYAGWFDIDWSVHVGPKAASCSRRCWASSTARRCGPESSRSSSTRTPATFAVWAYDTHKLPVCPLTYPTILGREKRGVSSGSATASSTLPNWRPQIAERAQDLKARARRARA